MHVFKSDAPRRFLPEHEQCFPRRAQSDMEHTASLRMRADFPDTGTPDAMAPRAAEEIGPVEIEEYVAPVAGESGWADHDDDECLNDEAVA